MKFNDLLHGRYVTASTKAAKLIYATRLDECKLHTNVEIKLSSANLEVIFDLKI